MEEQKRRAEADKLAAITALEQRSRDFMAEKEANRRLEQKIASMQSQLLTGGAALQDTPAFRWGCTAENVPVYCAWAAKSCSALQQLETACTVVGDARHVSDRATIECCSSPWADEAGEHQQALAVLLFVHNSKGLPGGARSSAVCRFTADRAADAACPCPPQEHAGGRAAAAAGAVRGPAGGAGGRAPRR